MLLLGDGGRVVTAALALTGLQRVVVALHFDGAGGQQHVMSPERVPVDLRRLRLQLFRIGVFPGFGRRGQIDHLDVRDAGLPQGQVGVGQLQLLHVVDGDSGVVGLLSREKT